MRKFGNNDVLKDVLEIELNPMNLDMPEDELCIFKVKGCVSCDARA
jgi:cytochrome c551/c552